MNHWLQMQIGLTLLVFAAILGGFPQFAWLPAVGWGYCWGANRGLRALGQ